MAYSTLKAAIQAVIKQNGNNEITGPILQQALLSMINSLGDGYQFKGVATPATNPGTPDQNVFYIASEVGTYSNFGLSVGENEVAVFLWNGTWSKQSTGAASAEIVNQLGQKADGLFNGIIGEFSKDGLSTYQDFYVGTIPKGTKIINNSSIPILVAKNGSLENRQDISAGASIVANSDKSLFRTLNVSGDVSLSFVLPIPDDVISTAKINDYAVTPKKTTLVSSINLVNKNDEDVSLGHYIDPYGRLQSNSSYNTTGYILVQPNTQYQLTSSDFAINARFICYFDINKTPLSGEQNVTQIETGVDVHYIRLSYALSFWTHAQVTKGENPIAYQDYAEIINPGIGYIGSIGGGQLKKGSIPFDSLGFLRSVNLVNKNDPDVSIGYYLAPNGSLSPNSIYNTTGFLQVAPNSKYQLSAADYIHAPRFINTYDQNKVCLAQYQYLTEITTGENVHFIRVTESTNYWQYSQVSKGALPIAYQDYAMQIPGELVSKESGSDSEKILPFFLPKHIYVANGRTIEIYYEQIMLNANRYNIQATCPIGKALERKFQIIGDASHVGNIYTLSIYAYDDFGNMVASGNSTIHIVSSTISAGKNILPVGDSLTNGKPWLSELHTLSANLTTIGTRQGIHEGRSGATVSTYTNVSGGIVYDYDNEYSDDTIPIFDSSASYSPGDRVRIAHTFGNGTSGYRYWIFIQPHTPGAFNEDEAYCYSGGNPFYDYVNGKFSMAFYQSFFGISYDAILLFLGTNGINLEPETNPNGALGIKNLIELIREDEPTKPIIVVNTIFRSNQNGIGNQGNTDGYVAQSAYKFNEDKKVLLLAKAVDDLCGDMANVYLCPVGFTHDSKYDFGNNKVQVNPRLSSTDDVFELMPSDSVHPQTPGYMQMADEIFSTLCAIFGN